MCYKRRTNLLVSDASDGRRAVSDRATSKSSIVNEKTNRDARTPIHTGEALYEDLDALGVGAADRRADEPHHPDPQSTPRRHGQYGLRHWRYICTSGEFSSGVQKRYELVLVEQESRRDRLPVEGGRVVVNGVRNRITGQ